MRPGVHNHEAIAPPELRSQRIAVKGRAKELHIAAIRHNVYLLLRRQTALHQILPESRREHADPIGAAARPAFEPVEDARQQRSRL